MLRTGPIATRLEEGILAFLFALPSCLTKPHNLAMPDIAPANLYYELLFFLLKFSQSCIDGRDITKLLSVKIMIRHALSVA